ncbi:hypothetical protein L596_019092 [Steinernema carpocapsae]|uniref:Uncharacterized protein n=1 Tax=Steinernema carpocapsae TaxID=34508 RepID=A0A4V6A290_STECR|nr:hypothetical protein L596_019092 [Steinernema carpocapsae]
MDLNESKESPPLNVYLVLIGLIVGQVIAIIVWTALGFTLRLRLYSNDFNYEVASKSESRANVPKPSDKQC